MLSEQLRDKYTFDISLVTVGMMGSILMAMAMAAAMAAQQIVEAARMPTIRLQSTKAPPDLPLAKGHRWHMFLSHIWGTGQDQCATIKRQLKIMLPGASVFLDVDDLQSIDALEEYIESSAVITIFVSKGYFLSKSKLLPPHTCPTATMLNLDSHAVCVPRRLPPRGVLHIGASEAPVPRLRPSARRRAAPRPRGRVRCQAAACHLWAAGQQA